MENFTTNNTMDNQQLEEILQQIQSNTNKQQIITKTSKENEYNPEQLILKIPVEQLQNQDIKIIMESTTIEKETDTILSLLGYNQEEQNQIRRKYNQIIVEENEQQTKVTSDLNKKRKRNNEDNEEEEQPKHMEKLIELIKEQTEQNEQIIELMRESLMIAKDTKKYLNYLYTEKSDKKRRRLMEENTERPKATRKRKNLTPMQIQYQERRKAEIREEESLRKRMKDIENSGYFDKH